MLIGSKVNVLDKDTIGEVVNETKNTFVVDTGNGLKTVVKDSTKIIVQLDNKTLKIRGEDIKLRPWEYAIR